MTFSLPTTKGSIEVAYATGSNQCIVPGCKIKGGGFARFEVHSVDYDESVIATVCGNHLSDALGRVIQEALPVAT